MKELTKKGIALASAGMIALSGTAGVAFAAQGTPALNPTTDADKILAANGIEINKTINAPIGTNTAGMNFVFDFQAVAPVLVGGEAEDGAFAVPNATADEALADSNQTAGQPIDIATVTLTAAAQDADTKSLSDHVSLPDPNFYKHAGVYTYEVTEAVTNVPAGENVANWDMDQSKYRMRVYVKNATQTNDNDTPADPSDDFTENVLVYDKITIEQIKDIDNVDCNVKVDSMDFTNNYTALSQLTITKQVSGDYANRSKAFEFALELDLPDYITGDSITIDGTSYSISNGKVTIPNFTLAADASKVVTGIPVGTTYKITEVDPTDGVNNYVPSATYVYSGAANAATGFDTHSNTVAAGTAGAANYIVNQTAGTQNTKTAIGLGSDNSATILNTLDNPPSPTGVLVQTLPFALIVAIPAILGAIAIASRKRDGEDA